jgi:preprotein translocase subunit SecB
MPPVCQLEDYVLTRLHLDFIPPQEDEVQINQARSAFDYSVGVHQKEKHRYRLEFRVKCHEADSKGNKVGYELETEIVGFFSFNESDPKEKMEMLVRLNGVSILYGILRGIVATASGSFPAGKFLLPTVMPQDVVESVEKGKVAAKKKEDGAPAKKRTESKKKVVSEGGKEHG